MFTKVTLTYARMSVLCEDHTGGTSSRGERKENEASVMGKRIYGALHLCRITPTQPGYRRVGMSRLVEDNERH